MTIIENAYINKNQHPIPMKFTNYLLSLLFIGTASTTFAANTSPFTSLQGSIESSSSNNDNDNNDNNNDNNDNDSNDNNKHQVHHRGLLSFTVGPTVSEGCSILPLDNGESCDKFNQQCLYQILESNDGRIYADFSSWSCGCGEDEVYDCGVRCLGSPCVTLPEPTAAPLEGDRSPSHTAPPIHSWCP
uniref:Uncharacterized protein n=1 Tax=Pseudo-nitzschia australis TaxID=44445 RepID=A0A7S4AM19_9STRA